MYGISHNGKEFALGDTCFKDVATVKGGASEGRAGGAPCTHVNRPPSNRLELQK